MVALIQILGDCVERLVSYVVVRARLIITIWLKWFLILYLSWHYLILVSCSVDSNCPNGYGCYSRICLKGKFCHPVNGYKIQSFQIIIFCKTIRWFTFRNSYTVGCHTSADCPVELPKCNSGACYRKKLANFILWLNNQS